VGLIGKVVASFDTAGEFPLLFRGLGFALVFAGILAVLPCLCFESHERGLVAPFNKVRSVIAGSGTDESCQEVRQSIEEVLARSLLKHSLLSKLRIGFGGFLLRWLLCR